MESKIFNSHWDFLIFAWDVGFYCFFVATMIAIYYYFLKQLINLVNF